MASMGPRSHERGNVGGDCYVICPLHASMGPRSHERGNGAWKNDPGGGGDASMGPRSHERGNGRVVAARSHVVAGFNGAAFS